MRRLAAMTAGTISRRSLLAAGAGVVVLWMAEHGRAASPPAPARDAWFWDIVRRVETRPPVGGPSAGAIDHSTFGVQAHRAGRVNPSQVPPSVSDFYVNVELAPDVVARPDWDVGVVWRTGAGMDALWWTISDDRRWSLFDATWEYSPRSADMIAAGSLCTPVSPQVTLHAVVFGSTFACSVNHGEVVVLTIPGRQGDGQVGILANALDEHLRSEGSTPYGGLTLWSLEPRDVALAPEKFTPTSCQA